MIKKNKLIFWLVIFVLIMILTVTAVYLFQRKGTPLIPGSQKCEIENCHGLEITCGPNKPETCTFIYEMGDNCRKYAKCGVTNGQCQVIKSDKFEKCKTCVLKCQKDFKDSLELSKCENQCVD